MLFKQITGKYADDHYLIIPPKSITIVKNCDVCPQKFVTLDSMLFHLVCYLLLEVGILALCGNTSLAMVTEKHNLSIPQRRGT